MSTGVNQVDSVLGLHKFTNSTISSCINHSGMTLSGVAGPTLYRLQTRPSGVSQQTVLPTA